MNGSGNNAVTSFFAAPVATCLLSIMCLSPGQAFPDPAPAVEISEVATFDEPWAMAFLPDGRLLITEKPGALQLVTPDGSKAAITGLPEVAYGGQGGLGDVALHPEFQATRLVYLSYAESGEGGRGAAVARARLSFDETGGSLSEWQVIWRQQPKVSGRGHYGQRIAFGPNGYLWISSGERQKFDPSQDMTANLGKIVRLTADGGIPADNPFAADGGVAAQIWSLGHRNPLGLAFDGDGRLWTVEMGPKGGDELNLVERGSNYGYPLVSEGDHYSGRDIPDHHTRPEFQPPAISWTPVISPSSLIFYSGSAFPDWRGNALISGLSAQGLIRVTFEGDKAREAQRIPMGARIRAVAQGPDGAIWLLQDGGNGKLLRLTPAR